MKKFKLVISQDLDAEDPHLAFDGVGTILSWSSKLRGDRNLSKDDPTNAEHYMDEGSVCLPIYMYDHSGITISTEPFSCRWDSGQVGWIYANPEEIANLSDPSTEFVKSLLRNEIKLLDEYLTGEVWSYTLEEGTKCGECGHTEFEELDSGCGFYGPDPKENGIFDHILNDHPDIPQEVLDKAWEERT